MKPSTRTIGKKIFQTGLAWSVVILLWPCHCRAMRQRMSCCPGGENGAMTSPMPSCCHSNQPKKIHIPMNQIMLNIAEHPFQSHRVETHLVYIRGEQQPNPHSVMNAFLDSFSETSPPVLKITQLQI